MDWLFHPAYQAIEFFFFLALSLRVLIGASNGKRFSLSCLTAFLLSVLFLQRGNWTEPVSVLYLTAGLCLLLVLGDTWMNGKFRAIQKVGVTLLASAVFVPPLQLVDGDGALPFFVSWIALAFSLFAVALVRGFFTELSLLSKSGQGLPKLLFVVGTVAAPLGGILSWMPRYGGASSLLLLVAFLGLGYCTRSNRQIALSEDTAT